MLLKSLKLKNFRQFKGEQQIDFSVDAHKNVTIVLGENGSGKTSLAQAFTWCLYGQTDFTDVILLCRAISQSMKVGDEEIVSVSLMLIHQTIEYTITSEQTYKKNNNNEIKTQGQRKFEITYKAPDGQTEPVKPNETDIRMKEILPIELSKYFFFDGERIDNMGKDIRSKGKSQEFSSAVQSILGLSAYTAALDHLKRGQGQSKSVLRSYDDKYDSNADNRIKEYTNKIEALSVIIKKIENRLSEIENENILINDKITDLNIALKNNETSKELANKREKLIVKQNALVSRKATQISDLLKIFNKNAPLYFSKKLMHDSLEQLVKANLSDKWIPDVHARTIDHLIKAGRCLCGAEISVGNEAYNELNRLREFIPPNSIGNLIESFRLTCENNVKSTSSYFDDFQEKYSDIRSFESEYAENEDEINAVTKHFEGMQDVGKLQAELLKYEKQRSDISSERSSLEQEKGATETELKGIESQRHELTLKDKSNRGIETYKTYAQYLFDCLSKEYTTAEQEVREKLSTVIDEIFRSIYNGGFSLSLDEKYNIQLHVIEHGNRKEDVETSQSQSISIIFAFIAGVIKMARMSQEQEHKMLVSEPFPLVMDAPLSAFDKTRIQTVCDVLPEIAEQIIIFIKDTDGEIAEKYLSDKIGSRAVFAKKNEFETYIEKGK